MVNTRAGKSTLGCLLSLLVVMAIGYFGVNAYTGKYGLHAQATLDQEMIALTAELARLKQERMTLEQRVSLLRAESLDPDMLDERARFQLEFAHPRDLVRVTTKRN